MSFATFTPAIGLKFDTLEKFISVCQDYAKSKGFVVSVANSMTNTTTKRRRYCELRCVRSGKNKTTSDFPAKRQKMTIKCDCKYRIRVKETENDWVITHFDDCHNHGALGMHEMQTFSKARQLDKKQMQTFLDLAFTDASNASISKKISDPENNKIVLKIDVQNLRAQVKNSLDDGDNGESLRPFLALLEEKDYIVSKKTNTKGELTHLFFAPTAAVEMVTFCCIKLTDPQN